jgi:phage baseplate assembly protein W
MARIEADNYTGKTAVKATYGKRTAIVESKLINPIDLEESVAIGVVLPFGDNSTNDSGYSKDGTSSSGIAGGTNPVSSGNTLFKSAYLTKDQVISNVRNLILTNRGERLMNPEFGTDIYNLLFEQNMPELDEHIRDSIQDAFDRYMPLCRIEDIVVTQKEHKIHIMLGFSVKEYNINEVLEITTGVA